MAENSKKPVCLAHDKWFTWAATCCGIGLIPKAPGTFGSIPGLVLGYALLVWSAELSLTHALMLQSLALISLCAFSMVVIAKTENYWKSHDSSKIVIDEVAGQALTALFVAPVWWQLAMAFLFFRIFDITKPSLVGYLDRRWAGALGTLADDLAAGLMAGATCWTILWLCNFYPPLAA